MEQTQYLNINDIVPLISPHELKSRIPITEPVTQHVIKSRQHIERILTHDDPRLLVVVGPCSIHDPLAAMEYAQRLVALAQEVEDTLYIVMRVYFEKPRTTVGWKGLINDPYLDGQYDISTGLKISRQLLLDINRLGLPIASETLDPILPQYIADLISWTAIGARTTESQTHRELASGLSMPVGFKNGTDGNLEIAINAMEAARHPHHFLGINQDGQTSIVKTRGNRYGHVILRGGKIPNYDLQSIQSAEAALTKAGFTPPSIMIDCSHGNSNKKHENQEIVWDTVIDHIKSGATSSITGMMVESNIHAGNQKIPADLSALEYGVSVTDACIDWETTERLLRRAAQVLG